MKPVISHGLLVLAAVGLGLLADHRSAPVAAQGVPPSEMPSRTWVTRPLCALYQCPFPAGLRTKDVNWTWDPDQGRIIFGTGDFPTGLAVDSGATPIYDYRLATDEWRTISTYCHPPGQITPNHPQDRGIFSYDSVQKRLLLGTSTPFPDQAGQVCDRGDPKGSIFADGLLALDRSTDPPQPWQRLLGARVGGLGSSKYNAKLHELLYIVAGGPRDCGSKLVAHNLTTHAMKTWPICHRSVGWLAAEYPERVFFGWDEEGQRLYAVFIHRDPSGRALKSKAVLYLFDRTAQRWSVKADPPVKAGTPLVPAHVAAAWSIRDKRFVYAPISSPCGKVRQLLVYEPGADAWEEFPVDPEVHGSTMAVDQAAGVLMFAGSVFCDSERDPFIQQSAYFWRYGR